MEYFPKLTEYFPKLTEYFPKLTEYFSKLMAFFGVIAPILPVAPTKPTTLTISPDRRLDFRRGSDAPALCDSPVWLCATADFDGVRRNSF